MPVLMAAEVLCKDCKAEGVTSARPAPHPGPRCVTHWRAVKKARRQRAHGRHVERTYGLTPAEYAALYAAQGGRCFICQHATGARKALAVDHEHNRPGCDHAPSVGCRECVRCLACTTCNRIVLGRYSVEALARAITVLMNPPARRVLASPIGEV
ncbi:endonuclease VII [Mycobacterium phage Aminay]|uniref:Endonuclease VII n=1 Tax=Mycobacterium phage Aminay TaxID=2250291 RepID=A0A345KV56_9CAUD|nr:endonuclease VII [Mycobacterium phage Aminay]AXH46908.1 endonuclease VII [Mycobacterium phage Aminay]